MNMLRVIKMSDVITVILISDGTDPIKGTPIDAQLSAFYKTNYQAQKKARMPIVTVFHGEKGSDHDQHSGACAVAGGYSGGAAAARCESCRAETGDVAPPKPVPSLVIIGSKAETTFNPPTDLPEHVDQPTLPAVVEQKPVETKAEVPAATTPEEKPKSVAAPVAPAPAPAVVAEPPKAVQLVGPIAATAPVTNEPPAAPVQTAVVVPEKNLLSVRNIAIVSVVFTILVCVLLLLVARNARNASRASLITRSLDRERK